MAVEEEVDWAGGFEGFAWGGLWGDGWEEGGGEACGYKWEGEEGKGKMAFGMFEDDGIMRPHPPVLRAVRLVKEVLVKLGHEVIFLPCAVVEGLG